MSQSGVYTQNAVSYRRFAARLLSVAIVTIMTLGLVSCGGGAGLMPASNPGPRPLSADLNSSVNHIIFMLQENRSFDQYFGQLPAYWQANGFPAQRFDGIPANASNPGFQGQGTINA